MRRRHLLDSVQDVLDSLSVAVSIFRKGFLIVSIDSGVAGAEAIFRGAAMSVNDKQVVRIYEHAMKEAQRRGLSGISRIEGAFFILKRRRDEPGMSADLSLAAAEWYAFARRCVAMGFVSKAQMGALSYAYYAKKIYDKALGDPNSEAVTSNPVSEPSEEVASWGMAGASQGEVDRAALNIKVIPPIWRSVDSIMGQTEGGYRALGTQS